MPTLFVALGIAAVAIIGLLFSSRASAGEIQMTDPDKPSFVPPSGIRGIRNNNPFNLEFRNIGWRGEIGTDGRFSVFDTPLNGIRAGMINIHTKMTRDGLTTLRRLLNVLSPAVENPTEDYISFVARETNLAAEQPLVFTRDILPLSRAIIEFENGQQPYSDELLRDALQATGRA